MKGRSRSLQRNTNLARALQVIQKHKAISRIHIARLLGLNKSTITGIVAELLRHKVIRVRSKGSVSSSGGRKPVLLALNETFGCILGMEIRQCRCRAVVLSLTGETLLKKELALPLEKGNFADTYFSCFNVLKKDVSANGLPLLGVGLGVPAKVDPFKGQIMDSYSLGVRDYEFGTQVASHLGYPVLLDNDANCCAWGELYTPGKKGLRNFLYIFVELKDEASARDENVVGIGFGVVINRHVHYGSHYEAGEFRSVFWREGQKELVHMSREKLLRIREDPSVLRRFVKELLLNLSVVISIIDPECIFIGGDLKAYFPAIREVLEQELSHRYIAVQSGTCKIMANTFDDYSVAQGAARMFLHKLFHNPHDQKKTTYTSTSWDRIFQIARGA